MQANMDKRCDTTPEAERQRAAIREAIAFKKYEFDAHGVEMNQRYKSSAVVTDGQMEPAFELDAELHYQPTTWPGARLPHVWLFDAWRRAVPRSILVGKGKFTVFTGIGGEPGRAAAEGRKGVGASSLCSCHRPAPRDHRPPWRLGAGPRDRTRGLRLVRPDQHVAWRAEDMAENPEAELTRVLSAILHRDKKILARQAARSMA
jgi:2,4-dichlorophenol 6-monooxygenase